MTAEQPSETNRQSFTISGSTLSGQVQLGNTAGGDISQAKGDVIKAGRDIIQGDTQAPLSTQDVVSLLQELETLLKSSALSTDYKEKALKYLDTTREEVQADEPEKDFALRSLQKVTKVLHDAEETVEATTSLWQKVEDIAEKLAPWFGVAAKTLLLL